MTSTVQDFPSILQNPCQRNYTEDQTWAGYVVDIAVLQQDMNTITKPDAYILNLDPMYISYAGFKALFYCSGTTFSPRVNSSNIVYYDSSSNIRINPTGAGYVLNSRRVISLTPTDCGQCQLPLDGSFNLLQTLLMAYETDLQIATECWDTCSLLEFYSIIDKIKTLTDITGECGVGIKCSLTLDEFFNQLEMQGLKMSGSPYFLPLDPSGINVTVNSSVSPNLPRPSVYPGLVTAVITANFHSTTPCVKDVQVRWPFLINFISIINQDISNNAIYTIPPYGIIDSSFSNPIDLSFNVGSYPIYVYQNGNINDGYRSPDLSYNTVDFSNNVFVPTDYVTGLHPDYTRYTAQKFSKIFYHN
jgi:hypothetical protein